jgi:asparagine synthase (glutamine-hydrolysing)
MCGIAGWYGGTPNVRDERVLDEMLRQIIHRGPDGEGRFQTVSSSGNGVALGHRRLAIIDLGGGAQPMSTEQMSHVISYNGELYNYKDLRKELVQRGEVFLTESDTEVVLRSYAHWGERCFSRFRGMFALAIWDALNDRLILARDHFGKKPLYYALVNGALIFSSELSSLISHPSCAATLDCDSVYEYLRFRYVPSPNTFVASIKKLPPGHYLSISNGHLRIERFFCPVYQDSQIEPAESKNGESEGVFFNLLEESIRLRMQSDVPYGAFLSGGIDSSSIVALMARNSPLPIKTFSIGFKEEQYSELEHAKRIAEAFKTQHHEIIVSNRDIIGHLERLTRNRCAPISEPADIPIYMLSKFAAQDVKVVLSGEGSDELLAGYPKHNVERWVAGREWLLNHPTVRKTASTVLDLLPGENRRARVALEAITEGRFEERMASWFGSFSERARAEIWSNGAYARELDGTPFSAQARWSSLRRILHFDQTSWLPDNLLERGDRMTMAASLEARMPFMDTKLARFVATLPDRALLRRGTSKYILRKCMQSLLPRETLTREKVGFRVPVDEWFRNDLREFVSDHICNGAARIARFIDTKRVKSIVASHQNGARNCEKQIWALLNLEIFLRTFKL